LFQSVLKAAMGYVHKPNPAKCEQDMAKFEATKKTLISRAHQQQKSVPDFIMSGDGVAMGAEQQLQDAVLEVNRYISTLAANTNDNKEQKEYGRMTMVAY
jgi:hypothetical protein